MFVYNIPDQLQGDTWNGINSISISVSGVPVDLTNAEVVMQVRKGPNSPVALELSTNNKDISCIGDPANGTITIGPTLITIPYGTYEYGLKAIFADTTYPNNAPRNKTYMKGVWNILPPIVT